MLRINLLPPSVNQRRLNKKIILGFGALFALCVLLPLLYNASIVSQLNQQRQDADSAVQGKAVTDGLKTQAAAATSQIAPITTKLTFAKAVFAYNNRLANLYYNLAEYTDTRIIYTDAVYSGSTMTIKAYSPSIAEVGRYLQRIYQDPDFSSVAIDKIPGYPDGSYYKYYVGKTLVAIGTPPGGAGQPGAGGPGPGGPAPGFAAPGRGGFGAPGPGGPNGPFSAGATAAAPGAAGAAQFGQTSQLLVSAENGQGESVTPIEALVQKSVIPGITLQRQIAEYTTELQRRVYAKRIIKGFPFTVTVTLVNPPVAPQVPGAAGGAAGSSGVPPGSGRPSGPGA